MKKNLKKIMKGGGGIEREKKKYREK